MSELTSDNTEEDRKYVNDLEALYEDQKCRLKDLISTHKTSQRRAKRELSKENPAKAKRDFWTQVTGRVKEGSFIPSVLNQSTGELKCQP